MLAFQTFTIPFAKNYIAKSLYWGKFKIKREALTLKLLHFLIGLENLNLQALTNLYDVGQIDHNISYKSL